MPARGPETFNRSGTGRLAVTALAGRASNAIHTRAAAVIASASFTASPSRDGRMPIISAQTATKPSFIFCYRMETFEFNTAA
jgi:hypothetical protein